MRWMVLALALAFGCDKPPIVHRVILGRSLTLVEVDSLSQIGLQLDDPENAVIAAQIEAALDTLECDAEMPPIMVLDADESDSRGFGDMRFIRATQAASCDDLALDSIDAEHAAAQGPALIHGLEVEAHAPIGVLAGERAGLLPEWWTITARHTRGGIVAADERLPGLDEGEATASWSAAELAALEIDGRSMLDRLIARGAQPDVEVDGDELEVWVDSDDDGLVDGCQPSLGADGSRIAFADCLVSPEYVDAFELRIRFLLTQADVPGATDDED